MPAWVVPAIAAAANLAGSAINAGSAGNLNRKNRKHQRGMYDLQRRDALADWNAQNAYNSPLEVMKRLKEGGLNPNLVYDNGAGSWSGGQVRSSDTGNAATSVPEWGNAISSPVGAYMDAKINQLTQQKLLAEITNQNANTNKTLSQTKSLDFMVEKNRALLAGSLEAQQLELQGMGERILGTQASTAKTKIETQIMQNRDLREAATSSQNIKESVARTIKLYGEINQIPINNAKIRAEINNLNINAAYKDYELQQLRKGIQPGTSTPVRFVAETVAELLKNHHGKVKENLKKIGTYPEKVMHWLKKGAGPSSNWIY